MTSFTSVICHAAELVLVWPGLMSCSKPDMLSFIRGQCAFLLIFSLLCPTCDSCKAAQTSFFVVVDEVVEGSEMQPVIDH